MKQIPANRLKLAASAVQKKVVGIAVVGHMAPLVSSCFSVSSRRRWVVNGTCVSYGKDLVFSVSEGFYFPVIWPL